MARCLFVYRDHDHESLAIEHLSAFLKRENHETGLILIYQDEKFEKRLIEKIEDFKPDFICFSVMTDDYLWACKTAEFIKKNKSIPIIFGGVHVTSCPEEVIKNKFVDYIVLGEGEEAIVELIENPRKKNIKNVWFKNKGKIIKNKLRPLIQDLDSLPFPDKELFFKEAPYLKGEAYYFMTSRGCPFGCSYCFNNYLRRLYKGCNWLRKRSIKNVLEELRQGKEKFNYHLVYFGDDCFTFDKKWLKDFFKEYKKEINVPFKALAHPSFLDSEIIYLLKKSGCIKLQIGVQTPVERVRKEICKRPESNELIMRIMEEIKKNKIFVQMDHLYGLPSQTVAELKEWISFYIDLKPDVISPYWIQYYPNSDIVQMAKEAGDIDNEYIKKIIRGELESSKIVEDLKKDKEIAAISRFFWWIPILPRPVSKYLLKKELYSKIFISDKLNIIPFFIKHLRSLELIRTMNYSRKRKKALKEHFLKITSKYN